MHALRYTNRILTVVAVLLTLNLYLAVTSTGPTAATPVQAADASKAKGVGSQAARQAEMAKALQRLAQSTERINQALMNGTARVKVENMPTAE